MGFSFTSLSSEFAGEKIPTLQETFELCEQLDLFLILDVKSNRRKVQWFGSYLIIQPLTVL